MPESIRKIVLITGCSSGIGFQTALYFARQGFKTYATVRNLESSGAIKLTSLAESEQLPLVVESLDVRDEKNISHLIDTIIKIEDRLDILVNNAGYGALGPIELFSENEIKQQYETNIFGPLRMIHKVLPIMRAQEHGTIINISSINGLIPFPLWGIYSSSKYAIETLSEVLHFEVKPFGIRVILIEPGSFLTNFPQNVYYPIGMNKERSPYSSLTTNFFNQYKMMSSRIRLSIFKKLFDPKRVVEVIFKSSQLSNPKLRYIVGIDARVYYIIKTIIPFAVWKIILKKIYKW